jgi:1-phosphofructokinase family hexose kinase
MILSLTPNPCVDKTVFVPEFKHGDRIRSERYTCIAGGKGCNVARAVKTLGYVSNSMVIVGGHAGRHVVEMIESDGVACTPVWVADTTRTITTVLEEIPHCQTAFFEPGPHVSTEEKQKIIEVFDEAVKEASVVTLNGTVPDPSIQDLYAHLIPIAHKHKVSVILDSHGVEFSSALEQKPYMVKPNLEELEKHFQEPLETEEKRWAAIAKLHNLGIELVVLSLGATGMLVSCGGERLKVTPPKIKEVNPVGSGDCLVAAFAIGIQEGHSLEDMSRIGCAAGAANASSWDIGHFSAEEVAQLATQVVIEATHPA